jgi:penicillin-binding protein 1A
MVDERTAVGSPVLAAARRRLGSMRNRRRRRRRLLGWTAGALVTALVGFSAGLLSAPVHFVDPAQQRSASLYDEHGRLFATIRSPQVRDNVPGSAIPTVVRDAVVAAEDARFYSEAGVDPISIVRAFWNDVTGGPLQGGSTITQQYVKNVYTGAERTALRKLREAALAIRLEQQVPKSEILTRYLNTVYFGNGTYGVQAASEFYFAVPVRRLDLDISTGRTDPILGLARAATLAGIIPAPSAWNPAVNPAAARSRELYTLNRMVANGMITADQASAAYSLGLPRTVDRPAPGFPTIAPEFRDLVERELLSRYSADVVFLTGLSVQTTLDYTLQQAAEAALRQVLPAAGDPEAALVAIDPRNGDLRAIAEKKVGGYVANGFDLAEDASRSTGSTIKPFTLAVALEEGRHLSDPVFAPAIYRYPSGGVVHNAEPAEVGTYTLESALWSSVNTVYAPLAVQVGLPRVLRLAQAAGMHSGPGSTDQFKPPYYDAYALGVAATPESEAVAYATLMDHGVYHAPNVLEQVTAGGTVLYRQPAAPAGAAVMPRGVADQVVQAMAGVVNQGTGTAAAQPFQVYGKTGTTSSFEDAWFTGCTPTLCITVWMGYDHPRPMTDVEGPGPVFGGTLPAEIFARTWSDYRALGGDQR